jgi:hypothetical protein
MLIGGLAVIAPSANADSSIGQTFTKFLKKCERAGEDDSQKKADQSEDQFLRHGGIGTPRCEP